MCLSLSWWLHSLEENKVSRQEDLMSPCLGVLCSAHQLLRLVSKERLLCLNSNFEILHHAGAWNLHRSPIGHIEVGVVHAAGQSRLPAERPLIWTVALNSFKLVVGLT